MATARRAVDAFSIWSPATYGGFSNVQEATAPYLRDEVTLNTSRFMVRVAHAIVTFVVRTATADQSRDQRETIARSRVVRFGERMHTLALAFANDNDEVFERVSRDIWANLTAMDQVSGVQFTEIVRLWKEDKARVKAEEKRVREERNEAPASAPADGNAESSLAGQAETVQDMPMGFNSRGRSGEENELLDRSQKSKLNLDNMSVRGFTHENADRDEKDTSSALLSPAPSRPVSKWKTSRILDFSMSPPAPLPATPYQPSASHSCGVGSRHGVLADDPPGLPPMNYIFPRREEVETKMNPEAVAWPSAYRPNLAMPMVPQGQASKGSNLDSPEDDSDWVML